MSRPRDFYPTPPWCVNRLLDVVHLPEGRWLEPSIGDGALVRAVEAHPRYAGKRRVWTGVDLDTHGLAGTHEEDRVFEEDYLKRIWLGDEDSRYDVGITNPPFSLAEEFVTKMLEECENVVVLVRETFIGSEGRDAWLRSLPRPWIGKLPQRFNGAGGGDTAFCQWLGWGPCFVPGTWELLALSSKEERAIR